MTKRLIPLVRNSALLTSLLILIPWYVLIGVGFLSNREWFAFFWPVLVPIWLPHFVVFWNLRGSRDDLNVKQALATVITWSSVLFLLSVLVSVLIGLDDWAWRPFAYAVALSLIQVFTFVSAVKCYYTLRREEKDWHILAIRALFAGFAPLTLAGVMHASFLKLRPHNEASVVGGLRTLNAGQKIYADNHPAKGFASSLGELGPSPDAQLIDALFSSGEKSGYLFIVYPTAADSTGRVVKYEATARPKKFTKNSSYSFFTDETGTIYYTKENRAATAADLPLP